MKVGVVLAVMVVAVVVSVAMPGGEAAVTCQQVSSCMSPCIAYLISGSGNPTNDCCNGVRNLQAMTPTTPDRRAACDCLKEAAGRNPNIKDDAAASLPTKCGVQISIPISRTVNCNE